MEESVETAGATLQRMVLCLVAALGLGGLSSCAGLSEPAESSALRREVSEQLVALPGAGEHTRQEAQRIARVAVEASQQQAERYDILFPGWAHNVMVNTGLRERGLCWHWMEELFPKLRALDTRNFNIVCGVRDSGTRREHHCVVAVPAGRSFEDGLVLDPWAKGGRLLAFPVRGEKRPWVYDPNWTLPLEQRYLAAHRKPAQTAGGLRAAQATSQSG
jgi:hypothetical protein